MYYSQYDGNNLLDRLGFLVTSVGLFAIRLIIQIVLIIWEGFSALKARYRCAVLLLITFLLLACASGSTGEPQKEKEARAFVTKLFSSQFSKCGGDYYRHVRATYDLRAGRSVVNTVTQVKGAPEIVVRPYQLSEPDRLNGYEFKGRAVIHVASWRHHIKGGWSEWRRGDNFLESNLSKKRGEEWDAGAWRDRAGGKWGEYKLPFEKDDKRKEPYNSELIPIDCSQIPRGD